MLLHNSSVIINVPLLQPSYDRLLTQQQQFHFPRSLLSIFSEVFINHFRPLGRGFIFLTHSTPHGSQCSLQDCCLVGKYHLGKKCGWKPFFDDKGWSWARRLPFLMSCDKRDEVRSSARGKKITKPNKLSPVWDENLVFYENSNRLTSWSISAPALEGF